MKLGWTLMMLLALLLWACDDSDSSSADAVDDGGETSAPEEATLYFTATYVDDATTVSFDNREVPCEIYDWEGETLARCEFLTSEHYGAKWVFTLDNQPGVGSLELSAGAGIVRYWATHPTENGYTEQGVYGTLTITESQDWGIAGTIDITGAAGGMTAINGASIRFESAYLN